MVVPFCSAHLVGFQLVDVLFLDSARESSAGVGRHEEGGERRRGLEGRAGPEELRKVGAGLSHLLLRSLASWEPSALGGERYRSRRRDVLRS